MRCGGLTWRLVSAAVAVLFLAGVVGCDKGPDIVTSIEFDGATRTIKTPKVICTKQPDGGLVILAQDTPRRSVRVQLTQHGRLVVQKAGLRHEGMAGFVADSREVSATKVDDTFTISGRMPPNPGESQWHTFKIQTTCPAYVDALPPKEPGLGAP